MSPTSDVATPSYDAFRRGCPSRAALATISGHWGLLVLAALLQGPRRFGELRRDIEGVGDKTLSQTLQGFERDGLVIRTEAPGRAQRVDYELTDLGRRGAQRALGVIRWVEHDMDELERARREFAGRAEPPSTR